MSAHEASRKALFPSHLRYAAGRHPLSAPGVKAMPADISEDKPLLTIKAIELYQTAAEYIKLLVSLSDFSHYARVMLYV